MNKNCRPSYFPKTLKKCRRCGHRYRLVSEATCPKCNTTRYPEQPWPRPMKLIASDISSEQVIGIITQLSSGKST